MSAEDGVVGGEIVSTEEDGLGRGGTESTLEEMKILLNLAVLSTLEIANITHQSIHGICVLADVRAGAFLRGRRLDSHFARTIRAPSTPVRSSIRLFGSIGHV